MGDLGLQVCRKVDDVDGTKRAFLGANSTADTEPLGDVGDFRLGSDFDAQLAGANDRTRFLAFLPTFLSLSATVPR